MALKIVKSISLQGESKIEDVNVMTLSADISSENIGNTFIRQIINNQELYSKNRVQCRKDVDDFYKEIYDIEDSFMDDLEKKKEE